MPVGGGGVKQHRSAGHWGIPLAWTRVEAAVQFVSLGGTDEPNRRSNGDCLGARCIGTDAEIASLTGLRRPFGASRCAHADRPTEPAHRPPDVHTRPAKPSTGPSADATGRSRSGSCRARRARAPPTWRAIPRSAEGVPSEPPRAGTVRQHASPTPTTCRGVPIPRHEGPGRVSRPPEKSPSPFRLFGGFL